MNPLVARGVYLLAMAGSFTGFLLISRPLVAAMPHGPIQFWVTFCAAVAVLLVGALMERRIWKESFGPDDPIGAKKTVPAAPLSIGAAAGIMLALYV